MTNLIIYTLKKTNVSLVIREFHPIFALSKYAFEILMARSSSG